MTLGLVEEEGSYGADTLRGLSLLQSTQQVRPTITPPAGHCTYGEFMIAPRPASRPDSFTGGPPHFSSRDFCSPSCTIERSACEGCPAFSIAFSGLLGRSSIYTSFFRAETVILPSMSVTS